MHENGEVRTYRWKNEPPKSGYLYRGARRPAGLSCSGTTTIRCGSKLAVADEIHTHVASKDGDDNGTVKIDKLASSIVQLLVEPCYPSAAVDQHKRLRRHTSGKNQAP